MYINDRNIKRREALKSLTPSSPRQINLASAWWYMCDQGGYEYSLHPSLEYHKQWVGLQGFFEMDLAIFTCMNELLKYWG